MEAGKYIGDDGSNFWDVEPLVAGQQAGPALAGKRLFAGSDRDYGIQIFRYDPN